MFTGFDSQTPTASGGMVLYSVPRALSPGTPVFMFCCVLSLSIFTSCVAYGYNVGYELCCILTSP